MDKIKNCIDSAILTSIILAATLGCSSYSEGDIHAERLPCNGELETSHSVTIFTSDKDKEPKPPKITQICVPVEYETETNFEKENRRVK